MSVREKRNGKYRTMLEQGDVYPGSYQVGPTFAGQTSDAGIRIKAIEGKSVQAVSTGKQLFDASKIQTTTMNGVTLINNGDGSFNVEGTPDTTSFSVQVILSHELSVQLVKEGPIYANQDRKIPYAYIAIFKNNQHSGKETNTNTSICSITAEDLNDPTFQLVFGFYGQPSSWNPAEKYKPMFYQDGDGTYEPYTGGKPGPQPEYPIPIESAEINKAISHGTNILDVSNVTPSLIEKNGNVQANGSWATGDYIPVGVNKNVVISQKNINFLQVVMACYDSSKTFLGRTTNQAKANQFVFDIPDNTSYVRFCWSTISNSTTLDRSELMANFGTSKAEYMPYKEIHEEMVSPKVILRSLPDGTKDEYKDGKIIRRVKEVVFDGSSDEVWNQGNAGDVVRVYIILPDCERPYGNTWVNPLCSRGSYKYLGITDDVQAFYWCNGGANRVEFYFYPPAGITNVTEFKQWLSTHPVTALYPLATPTIEPINLPILPSSAPSGSAQTDSLVDPVITWEALPAGSCAREVQELRKRIEELESEVLNSA